jgi:acetyl-CoA carboxylase biotin carboxyl carrier protein
VDAKDIEQLIQLMRRMGVMHLALEQPEYKISITRGAEAAPAGAPAPAAAATPAAPPVPAGVAPAREAIKVPSPVVGQVRSDSAERGRPLPAVGERVKQGQLLAIVEAMKVPNEVRSPVEGVVSSVLVEDGSPVEFGQTLLVILPEEGGETDEDETPLGVA